MANFLIQPGLFLLGAEPAAGEAHHWFLQEHPGWYFVIATLLPLASFLLILLSFGLWCVFRTYRDTSWGEGLYNLFGGDRPGPLPAYVATGAMALAFVFSLAGFVLYVADHREHHEAPAAHAHGDGEKAPAVKLSAWSGSFKWLAIAPTGLKDPEKATALSIGFHVDGLTAIMFLMVTFVATLIHIYSIGYMGEELQETVEDHQVHAEEGHLRRRGRFGRFFLYLSLFCFSMLNLVLADNLFQVFLSWELVGICSYLLIGFYFERQSASNAANKAFITNRIGDAGFILGLLILWTYLGTFNFQEIFDRLRSPAKDSHNSKLALHGRIVVAEPVGTTENGSTELRIAGLKDLLPADRKALEWYFPGNLLDREAQLNQTVERVKTLQDMPTTGPAQVVLFPREADHWHGLGQTEVPFKERRGLKAGEYRFPANVVRGGSWFDGYTGVETSENPDPESYGMMPYWVLVLAGLGIFLGCVGKSAQFPLQVWLPDAMEGPTPVSALIHAATMVAAGVYLVGRAYPIFTQEVLLIIAYTGAITLVVAATIAIVMTDIKKVLAYSTVSQLGYMMLALGVGGWVAGLFHLITHAIFKALLFLGSGSVIYGCHHEQEMTKMGGLFPKMRITALTMLAGLLAIAGFPLFTGWYSKDSIVAQSLGFAIVNNKHLLLFVLPLVTAGITAFYMSRMWLMTFVGKPRDKHVYENAHESPPLMTVPLIILAVLSICAAWGWPIWDAQESYLEKHLHHTQPTSSIHADFGHVYIDSAEVHPAARELLESGSKMPEASNVRFQAAKYHDLGGALALLMVALGVLFAWLLYGAHVLDPAEVKEQMPALHRFLSHKWFFDEVYSVLVVRPAMVVALAFRWFDQTVIDGIINFLGRLTVWVANWDGIFDRNIIDGTVNVIGGVFYGIGDRLRGVQTGNLRNYVLFLVLAAVGIFVVLSYYVATASAG